MDALAVIAVIGGFALFLSIIGGREIRIKGDWEIPVIPKSLRIISGLIGIILISIVIWFSYLEKVPHSPSPLSPEATLSAQKEESQPPQPTLGIIATATIQSPQTLGKIVFDSPVDEKWQVFIINPDGSGLTQLTNIPEGIGDPAISPDGTSIVVTQGTKLLTMNSDGTEIRIVYETDMEAGWPSWSPNSRKIVFASQVTKYKNIFMMNYDGTSVTQLTDTQADDLFPAFSPDGQHIVFSSNRSGNWEIYTLALENGSIEKLTNLKDPDNQLLPAWSPDGSSIVFESRGKAGKADIFVMNTDGTEVENITNNSAYDCRAWQRYLFMPHFLERLSNW